MIKPPQLQLTDYRHHRNATVDSIDAAIPTIREWFTNESNGTRYYINTVLDHLEHGAINPGAASQRIVHRGTYRRVGHCAV